MIGAQKGAARAAKAPSPPPGGLAPPAASGAPGVTAAGNLQTLHALGIRASLTVSAPSDPDEREADAVADRVMRMPQPAAGGCAACSASDEPCPSCGAASIVRRQADAPAPARNSPISANSLSRSAGPGRPLDDGTRTFFEPRLGADLSRVRIHTDPSAAHSARDFRARAYALGSDIFFADGEYSPESEHGKRLLAHELAHTLQPPPQASHQRLRRSWYDPFVSAGEWVGGKLESGGEAAWHGTEWVGGKLYAGGRWVLDTADEKLTAAWRCAQGAGSSLFSPLSFDLLRPPATLSLSEVTGVARPAGDEPPTSILTTAVKVLKHPCIQMLPGAGLLLGGVKMVSGSIDLLRAAWEIYQNPDPLIERIHAALGGMIVGAASKATAVATAAVSNDNVDCVLRHLGQKLDYMRENWWPILKEMAWDLIWPWPGVKSDFVAIWEKLKSFGSHLWDLDFSRADDDALSILRHLNSAAGRLYGWFLIGSVLVGAIAGGIAGLAAGGAGALPGAAAGAASGLAFAGEVGYALLIATFIIEGASLIKAASNLSRPDRTPSERECDCELIASSSVTIGISGALYILGALAARLAKAILQRLANSLFERPPTVQEATARGRVVEARVSIGELIRARFRARAVTITDRLTPGGLLGERGNFPGIDLATDAQVTIRSQGQTLADNAALRTAMTNGQPINVDVNGGTITSIRSRGGASAVTNLQNDIRQLARFGNNPVTAPSFTPGAPSRVTVTITNPTGRVLVGVYEPGRLTPADISSLQTLAGQNGVTLQLHEGIPPNPIAVTTIESMPSILAELANEGTQVADDQQQTPAKCNL